MFHSAGKTQSALVWKKEGILFRRKAKAAPREAKEF
jgi:hypothetical protein